MRSMRAFVALVTVSALGAGVSCGPKPKAAPTTGELAGKGSDAGSGAGSAATGPAVTKPVDETAPLALDASIKTGVLPNGLRYYVKANKKPEQRVQLWLAVNAGSVLEDDDQRGMAHLLEHIAFEGTKRFPKHEIIDFIERSGMKFGADLNAYTSFDETVYQLMVPTDDPKTVAKGLDVLRDWSADVSFDPKEVIDERKIIEEERRTRNSSQFRMLQQILPVAYQGSKYAQRLPIGTPEVIGGATAETLKKLYQRWYRPDLMAVIVVGDIDAAALEQQVKAKFGDLPAAAGAPARPSFPVATNLPPRTVVARDKEQALFAVSVDFQMPHRPEASIADLRRSLTEGMFSSILGARLAIIANRAKSSWTGAGVGFGSNLRPVDELSLSATAKDGKLLDTIGDLASELARVRQHGFSTEEIDEARAATLRRFEESVREVDTRDSRDAASEILRNFLTHEYMIGAVRELELAQAVIPTITNAQLVDIAKLATDTGRVVTIQAPPKGDVPTEAAIAAKLAEGAAKQMPAWEATDLTQPLITADPTPGKITAEKALGNDVVQWSLSNGATVLLKHTDFKKDEVVVVGVSNGGTSQVANAQYPQALFAGAIVNTMGIGNYGPDELEKKLAGKKAGVAVSIDGEQERVEGTASPSDVLPMMQLVHGAFVEPHVDASAFEAWKLQQLQLAKLIGANTQAIFIIGAFDALFDHHPRIPLPFPTEQRIAAIKLDQAVAQYRARMANAADFGFVIVGAFDVAAMRPLVEKYLASLPATKAKHETVKDVGLKPHQGTLNKTVRAGDENKAMSMIVASALVPWNLTVEADAEILQGVLNIELLEVLREKLGGTYSVSVQSQADRSPPQRAMTLAVFESDPTRAPAMQAEAWKTLDALATTPVKDDTLAKVKEQIVKEHGANLLENAYWTGQLERVVRYGDDLATLVAIDRVTARVTAANVKKIAAQFVGKTNRVTVTLLPDVPAAKPAPKK